MIMPYGNINWLCIVSQIKMIFNKKSHKLKSLQSALYNMTAICDIEVIFDKV